MTEKQIRAAYTLAIAPTLIGGTILSVMVLGGMLVWDVSDKTVEILAIYWLILLLLLWIGRNRVKATSARLHAMLDEELRRTFK